MSFASTWRLRRAQSDRSFLLAWQEATAARKKCDEIQERDFGGVKYFGQLAPLLERLHEDGCLWDKAGNWTSYVDQHCLLVLLYLFNFNPICSSLRAVQQAAELPKA